MKTYQIVAAGGKPKPSWEEINCDFLQVSGDTLHFYDMGSDCTKSNLIIVYRLAEGEALLFLYGS